MADVKVNIKGDSRNLGSAVDKAKAKLRDLQGSAKRSTQGLRDGFKDVTSSVNLVPTALTAITAGLASLSISAKRSFQVFEDSAKRAATAANLALSSIDVNLPGAQNLEITSRDQLVELGQNAQRELSRINSQLDERGLLLRLRQNESGLQNIADGAVKVLGLFSSQVRAQEANNASLLEQRNTQEAILNFAQQQLEVQRQLSAIQGNANDAGITEAGTLRAPVLNASIVAPPRFRRRQREALPENESGFFDEVDEPVANAVLALRNFDAAVQQGVIPGLEAAQQRVDLLRQNLITLIDEGVGPNTVGFQNLKGQLEEAQSQLDTNAALVQKNAVAFNLLENVAINALDSILDRAQSVGDALRGIGRQLFGILARAGIQVGIGALTGNPLSFGSALASVVGVPTAASVTPSTPASVVGGKVPTVSPSSFGGSGPLQVEVVPRFERVSGGDFVIGFNQAESTFKRRGGA